MEAANDDTILDEQSTTEEKKIITPNRITMAFSVASDVTFISAAILVLATDYKLLGVVCFLVSRWLTKASSWMEGSLDTYKKIEEETGLLLQDSERRQREHRNWISPERYKLTRLLYGIPEFKI